MSLRLLLLVPISITLACSSPASEGGADAGIAAPDGAPFVCTSPSAVEATVLAEHGAGALGVVVADNIAYWANRDVGQVWQVQPPLEPVLIAGGQYGPTDVAVGGGYVYWGVWDGIMRRSIAGGEATTLATGQSGVDGIALDAEAVYWVNYQGGQVMKQELDGGSPVVLASGQDQPLDIVLSDTAVYWSNFGTSVMMVAKDGGPVETIAADLPGASGLAISATHLYWASRGRIDLPGYVGRIPLAGGEPTVLFTADTYESPSNLAVGERYLYWSQMNGEIWRSALDGGCAGLLTKNQQGANGIALADDRLFFSTLNTGALSTSGLGDDGKPEK